MGNRKMEKRKDKNDKLYLFHQGTYTHAYEYMGAHPENRDGVDGYVFRTWAPNAIRMAVVGDFNNWDNNASVMERISENGVWEVFIPGATQGHKYKFEVTDINNYARLKGDPYGFMHETEGKTASILYDINGYEWHDGEYLKYRNSNYNHSAFSMILSLLHKYS